MLRGRVADRSMKGRPEPDVVGLACSNGIFFEMSRPDFCSRFVAGCIGLDCLFKVAENERFLVSADLSQPHCVPRSNPTLRGI
ncbi:hypothetical protein SAMN05216228_10054 [Rhizobium tibeticum]|uniref:Uncharacterized protein n=1 Tax=Rhizobium tibeticum TaxID=501024 RepID=A0A1H8H0A2_9HYPH|nr:hypothetical protein RTCCBAU85039_1512 [Rhizobium tibeticum]SEN49772.1 hypothetical protein SAMN05216228_10054 [Rhizobium tibeticum]